MSRRSEQQDRKRCVHQGCLRAAKFTNIECMQANCPDPTCRDKSTHAGCRVLPGQFPISGHRYFGRCNSHLKPYPAYCDLHEVGICHVLPPPTHPHNPLEVQITYARMHRYFHPSTKLQDVLDDIMAFSIRTSTKPSQLYVESTFFGTIHAIEYVDKSLGIVIMFASEITP